LDVPGRPLGDEAVLAHCSAACCYAEAAEDGGSASLP